MLDITTAHLILGALELVVWYSFLVYLIHTIKRETVNIWTSSAILLVLFYLGSALCPWLRHTEIFGA